MPPPTPGPGPSHVKGTVSAPPAPSPSGGANTTWGEMPTPPVHSRKYSLVTLILYSALTFEKLCQTSGVMCGIGCNINVNQEVVPTATRCRECCIANRRHCLLFSGEFLLNADCDRERRQQRVMTLWCETGVCVWCVCLVCVCCRVICT